MLIKWVTCRAVDREAFHRGQLGWARLRGLPGFLGQCGGWSLRDDRVAHVFGWWAGEPDYRAFMAGAHDGIAAGQAGTYESIEVRLFAHLSGAVGDGTLLRLAHCHVRTGRSAHFVRAQAEVWNPGMSAAPGMLGGAFARRGDTEFLVLSRWRSVADHDGYLRDRFADLRSRSGAAQDLDAITGDLIGLQPSWTVPA